MNTTVKPSIPANQSLTITLYLNILFPQKVPAIHMNHNPFNDFVSFIIIRMSTSDSTMIIWFYRNSIIRKVSHPFLPFYDSSVLKCKLFYKLNYNKYSSNPLYKPLDFRSLVWMFNSCTDVQIFNGIYMSLELHK